MDIFTDHKNLEYFKHPQKLTRRQARWTQIMQNFFFTLHYKPGTQNPPNILSQMDNLETGEKDNEEVTVLPPELFTTRRIQSGHQLIDRKEKEILKKIRKNENQYNNNTMAQLARELKAKGKKIVKGDEWEFEDRLLLHNGKIYVPKDDDLRTELITLHHDTPIAGHPGKWKTLEPLSQNYWWPLMTKAVTKYIQGCVRCQQTKAPRNAPPGKLHPNEVPSAPWEHISVDMITGLPMVNQFNAILTVIDRFIKQIHILPTTDTLDSPALAEMYRDQVWQHHGLPKSIRPRPTICQQVH